MLCVQNPEALTRDMGVDGGRRNVGVPQQQLDSPQVRTVVQQMGRERVTQGVWR